MAEVDRVEQASQAEAKAAELFEAGQDLAKGVVDILGKVARLDQLPLYYSGGFRVLASLLTNGMCAFVCFIFISSTKAKG